MTAEEKLVQAQAEVERLKAQVSGFQAVINVLLGVLTDQQFGQVRAKLDALDAAR